jgi:hypothetical protein
MEPPHPTSGAAQPPEKRLTCFVSAPATADLTAIHRILATKGVTPLVVARLAPVGSALADLVAAAVAKADFVLAILDAEQSNANVYYEAGYAAALGKRVLLIAPPEVDSLPAALEDTIRLRTTADNRGALEFALDQLMAAPPARRARPGPPPVAELPVGPLADRLLQQLEEAGDSISPQHLESVVHTALRASGIAAIARSDESKLGIDFAVWSDSLNPWLGAPLLVEVKKRIGSRAEASRLLDEMAAYVQQANVQWALLLYLKATGFPSDLDRDPQRPVLVLSVRDLLNGLRERSFGEIVRELWDRRARALAV